MKSALVLEIFPHLLVLLSCSLALGMPLLEDVHRREVPPVSAATADATSEKDHANNQRTPKCEHGETANAHSQAPGPAAKHGCPDPSFPVP